jgi:iron complex transport system substrate-binding protein
VSAANGAVHIGSRPTSIISLSPTSTEMLYAIGAGSQVKAVDSDSDYPPQAPMTKLSGFQPNVEAIVGYKPDLVVVDGNTGGLIKSLSAFKIPVLELPAAAKLSDVYAQFDELGQATGHLAQAEQENTKIRSQLKQIAAAAPPHQAPLTYYYELDQTYYSVTSATFVGQLLHLLGMKSIADTATGAAAAGGYPQLSSEFIIKANPDYIILADTICCHQSAATVAGRPGWPSRMGTSSRSTTTSPPAGARGSPTCCGPSRRPWPRTAGREPGRAGPDGGQGRAKRAGRTGPSGRCPVRPGGRPGPGGRRSGPDARPSPGGRRAR